MKPNSPLDAWRTLAIGMNNGKRRFVFDFKTKDQANKFTEMTNNITRWKVTIYTSLTKVDCILTR